MDWRTQCKSRLIVDRLGEEFKCCTERAEHAGPHRSTYLGTEEWTDGDWERPSYYEGELASVDLAMRYLAHELAKANREIRHLKADVRDARVDKHNAKDAIARALKHLARGE